MRTGTYVPSDPREIHAFAMERLNKKCDDMSKELASLEEQSRKGGCSYHSLPIHYREEMMSLPLRTRTVAAFVVVDDEGSDLIDSFNWCRVCRDDAKQALHASDIETAEQELNDWEAIQDDVATQLESVLDDVFTLTDRYRDGYYMDNEPDAAQVIELRKAWILTLPEVVKAFELSIIETEEQAVEMALSDCESITQPAVLGLVEEMFEI
ncbi:hypothetical protein M409DRAFT_56554 [Zasmidium cellare ATCC 36951]|uniref:Uncharacterized protein n=1 Tax=Zasmidium cellare ATCC 36951 TaxID=1080233 RepID=A0A6A6CC47_ZASCE|nr:uncharacterized protein M409DRAFT_56554 [Zasmidium cellare ATCC 36951]KAF2164754.1 hypothetical protein M409DRAFT_56554 [Zasmidium cellare ATCC 36951]